MQRQQSFQKIGLWSGIFLSISASVGSGWLYASYYAGQTAGGGAVYAWLIAGLLFLFLGLCFAEVAGIFPQRGMLAIVPSLTHNSTFAMPFAVSAWLGLAAVVALEATATIEYMVELLPRAHALFYSHGQLTAKGTVLALVLVMLYAWINYWGARVLTKVNNIVVIFKLIVPASTGILLLVTAFHATNFVAVGQTMLSYGTESIMTTIVGAGLITTFNGLQVITGYASEVKNPKKTIPLVIISSTFVVLAIYLLLQVAFIGALSPAQVQAGWHQLNFEAPMVQLVGALGLGFMAVILYTNAMVSPLADIRFLFRALSP
ncbi:MAG: APC family permease [Desulfopila sp.]